MCKHSGKFHELEFNVIDRPAESLIGLHSSLNLNIITVNNVDKVQPQVSDAEEYIKPLSKDDIYECYGSLFNGSLGKLPVEYRMKLDPNVKPVIRPPRRIPIAVQDKVKAELDRLVDIGVIVPVSEPTDWVSLFVVTKKKGTDEIRLCIDPLDLNEAIQRPHYPMRTVEEVAANILQTNMFTVLDASSGFWQIPLEQETLHRIVDIDFVVCHLELNQRQTFFRRH